MIITVGNKSCRNHILQKLFPKEYTPSLWSWFSSNIDELEKVCEPLSNFRLFVRTVMQWFIAMAQLLVFATASAGQPAHASKLFQHWKENLLILWFLNRNWAQIHCREVYICKFRCWGRAVQSKKPIPVDNSGGRRDPDFLHHLLRMS